VVPDVKHVQATITADGREADVHPMYDLWANAPFVERATALQWNVAGDALGILHYAVGDVDAVEVAVADVPQVVDYEVAADGPDAFYAYVRDETTDALADLFAPLAESSVIAVPPVRYREDGSVSVSLFGPDAELQAAVDAVPDPVEVTVESVGGLEATAAAVGTRLTERQREAVRTAVELGYYEVPREAGHDDVAEAIGCAPSTAAEHLRKAESTVLSSLFGR
jgi:predicted DNA binding protein